MIIFCALSNFEFQVLTKTRIFFFIFIIIKFITFLKLAEWLRHGICNIVIFKAVSSQNKTIFTFKGKKIVHRTPKTIEGKKTCSKKCFCFNAQQCPRAPGLGDKRSLHNKA